ncbi:MAG: endo-1,4-beta-xylanase [Planctomycetia bacterium]|nr:endo-1,4-beta-xylanase [Planctomycetia bacterium]
MGVMRFVVHPTRLLSEWPEVHRAYLSGVDQAAWPTRIEISGNEVLCRRQNNDSGKLNVAWPVPGFGRPVLSTASLPEREMTYILAVELARGKIVQVRNQLAVWQAAGMTVPAEFQPLHREAHQLLAKSVGLQDDPAAASEVAQQAIVKECQAAEIMMHSYIAQRLEVRHKQYPQLPTVLGCSLGDSPLGPEQQQQFLAAFGGAAIPLQWRCIEPEEGDYRWDVYDAHVDWAIANNLLLRGGPLIDLSPNGLPKWLAQWEHDYWNLQSFVCDFIETVMSRYVGKIRIWEIAARPNAGGALALTEENRLTLVAKILEVGRQVDPEAQFLIRIDQPWGEYQARGMHKLSPMHFADALVRAGMELAAINLEIGVGYTPIGSPSRDLIDFSRMIDQWSVLGLPLQVTLAFPSDTVHDEHQTTDFEVDAHSWKVPVSEDAQSRWIEDYLPLLLAKPSVLAVFWNHLSDAQPHRFPHAGLIRPDGVAKPAHAAIVHQRKLHW